MSGIRSLATRWIMMNHPAKSRGGGMTPYDKEFCTRHKSQRRYGLTRAPSSLRMAAIERSNLYSPAQSRIALRSPPGRNPRPRSRRRSAVRTKSRPAQPALACSMALAERSMRQDVTIAQAPGDLAARSLLRQHPTSRHSASSAEVRRASTISSNRAEISRPKRLAPALRLVASPSAIDLRQRAVHADDLGGDDRAEPRRRRADRGRGAAPAR